MNETATSASRTTAHELDEQGFDAAITASDRLAVIDFAAPWCGPCRILEPLLGELATELEGRADFWKVDVDRSPQLAIRYSVQAVPTILFLKSGKVVDRLVGLPPKAALAERLHRHVGAV